MKSAKSRKTPTPTAKSPEELARPAVPPIRRPWALVLAGVLLAAWLAGLLVLALGIVY